MLGTSAVERFRRDLDALVAPTAPLGLAVSGGTDSLALLILAAEARPEGLQAATVDHGLRAASSAEAALVSAACARLGVPHSTLRVEWEEAPVANLQSVARERRYETLAQWANQQELPAIAAAHHLDDQAETFLMRVARGSGVAGLGGIRPSRALCDGVTLIRPLLGWRRSELQRIVADAAFTSVDDPSNRDERFDRTAARALLQQCDWLVPERVAASASHCRDSSEALDWVAARELDVRRTREANLLAVDASGLPREIKRRLLKAALAELGAGEPAGPDLMRALDRIEAGEVTTLAGIRLEGRERWRLSVAAPRRHSH